LDAQPPKLPPYLVEWAESQTHLRLAVRQFQRLLKQQTALGTDSAVPPASKSHANSLTDRNSPITAPISSAGIGELLPTKTH